jgi:hypothetical protein
VIGTCSSSRSRILRRHAPTTQFCSPLTSSGGSGEQRRLGLDDIPCWIVTTECNAFVWPGPDVRPVPGRYPATTIYGDVSRALLQRVAKAYLANRDLQRTRLVARTH